MSFLFEMVAYRFFGKKNRSGGQSVKMLAAFKPESVTV
jgi:hypothetical protein